MSIFIRISGSICLFLVLLELVMQSFAVDKSSKEHMNRSFDSFVCRWQKKGIPTADLYFVGDSTVFGSGSSNFRLYSMPVQLEKLISSTVPGFKIVSLAYPGSSTEEHLRLLALLPADATVIYRGGVSDFWKKTGSFQVQVGAKLLECRICKLFYLLFGRLLPKRDIETPRKKRIQKELTTIMTQKNFRLFTLDYITAPFVNASFPFFYLEDGEIKERLTHIPLREMLIADGFFGPNGLDERFISFATRTHSNDLGYFLEAIFIFNYLCRQELFGLIAENQASLNLLDEFSGDLIHKYEELKSELKIDFNSSGVFDQKLGSLATNVLSLLTISNLLRHEQNEQSQQYNLEHRMLKRLNTLLFRNPPSLSDYLMTFLNKYQRSVTAEERQKVVDRTILYHAIVRSTIDTGVEDGDWEQVYNLLQNSPYTLPLKKMTYLPEVFNYPLEFCCRFLQEGDFSPDDVSVKKEWEYFFTVPFDVFLQDKHRPPACECVK